MDIRNDKNIIFNLKLAKLTGLYQIIDPGTVKFRGRNIYHIVMACVLLYMCPFTIMMNISGVYYWTDNLPVSIDFLWKAVLTSFDIYKGWLLVRHSDDIWNCFSITRYDFSSFSKQNTHIVNRWRERFVWLTTIYYMMIYFIVFFSIGIVPLVFSDHIQIKNHHGSIGYYRQSVANLYLIVPDETYNTRYYMFYFVELLFFALTLTVFFMFDILLFSLSFGLCCQMEIISSAFESAGHKPLRDTYSQFENQDKNKKITLQNEHNILIYDELKKIIMDHQAVMEKYEVFLTLFRPVMLLQIVVSSFSAISLWFTFIMCFSNDDRFMASGVVLIKLFSPIPLILIQIFMICTFFSNTHNQKDSIIFALYRSNWNEMDMKCKKLILLTMKLNNANHKKLKFNRTKIVNLEMFFKTMGDYYTVISVFINYIQRNVE